MTPREFARQQAAAVNRARDEHDRGVVMAWQTANLTRAEKLPDLRTLLARTQSGRQTHDEMRAQLESLSRLTGFPLRKVVSGG